MYLNIGIDWSEQKHDVAFVNEAGAVIQEFTMNHSETGFEQLEHYRRQLGVGVDDCRVGLETAHTLLIDFLWSSGYQELYVLAPNVVKQNQGRYRQSGAKDDRWDAFLIGDLLRTDCHRFRPWKPGSELLQNMRVAVGFQHFLTKRLTVISNRLRSILLRYYPAAFHLFPSWPSQTHCRFILEFPTPAHAKQITLEAFQAFLGQSRHPRRGQWYDYYVRLHGDYPPTAARLTAAYQQQACWFAQTLLESMQSKKQNLTYLCSLFDQHPDAAIFRSIPGAGDFLAPALLVKFGEDRERFPSPAAVQALAGTAPVTKQSGKSRSVRFRRACDREFRHIAQLHARSSLRSSSWASAYYHSILSRKPSKNHALRCLANRWLKVIWALWQKRTPYDEAHHTQQILRYRTPVPTYRT